MKEVKNSVAFSLKGELVSFDGGVLTTIGKKDEEDSIDFSELVEDIKKFAEQNINKGVVVSFVATATE